MRKILEVTSSHEALDALCASAFCAISTNVSARARAPPTLHASIVRSTKVGHSVSTLVSYTMYSTPRWIGSANEGQRPISFAAEYDPFSLIRGMVQRAPAFTAFKPAVKWLHDKIWTSAASRTTGARVPSARMQRRSLASSIARRSFVPWPGIRTAAARLTSFSLKATSEMFEIKIGTWLISSMLLPRFRTWGNVFDAWIDARVACPMETRSFWPRCIKSNSCALTSVLYIIQIASISSLIFFSRSCIDAILLLALRQEQVGRIVRSDLLPTSLSKNCYSDPL